MKAITELGYAQGMVSRREALASQMGTEKTRTNAEQTFRSMLACYKEVSKHRNNIGNMLDDESAVFYMEAGELLEQAESWVEAAKDNFVSWGASDADVREVVRGVLGDA
jgi:inosine-uridine nucleoside N-ribohydrolase